jgi:hypothetical protein
VPSLAAGERPLPARTALLTAVDFDGGAVAVLLARPDAGGGA